MEKEIKRTNYCGELSLNDLNKTVSVVGWVSKKRNLGSLMFVDLRDRSGIIQVLIKTDSIEVPDIRNEYILNITGVVNKKDVANPNLEGVEYEGNIPSHEDQEVHTADDVILMSEGNGSEYFKGVMDNTEVFFGMMRAFGLDAK